MKDIKIRNVEIDDLSSVVDIQIKGWQTAYKGIIDDSFLKTMSKEERLEKRREDFRQNGFIVAELNKEIAGFCRYIDSNKFSQDIPNIDCELLAIYVKPELKYKGIGTKLFEYVVKEFKMKNKTKMILWCLKDNEPSKKFYTKMGGKIIKERAIKIGKKSYDEVGFIYNI